MPTQEESADFPEFPPARAHMLLKGFYRDYSYHNDGLHLDWGVLENTVWQLRWRQLVMQLASWYATPSGVVG